MIITFPPGGLSILPPERVAMAAHFAPPNAIRGLPPPPLSHPQVSKKEGVTFNFTEAPMGGAAIDLTGEPLPASTLKTCLARGAGMWLLGGIVL